MIEWIKRILGIKSAQERKQEKIMRLHTKAFNAQRNGDLSLAGKYQKEADELAQTLSGANNEKG